MFLAPFSTLGSRIADFFDRPFKPKPEVLVLGYGWGSRAFTQTLDLNKYNVTVVSPTNQRLNQPFMIHHLDATYTPPSQPIHILEDKAISLDEENKIVNGTKSTYRYDYLVIATGSEVNDFGIPGVKEYCLMCKTAEDIKAIREKIIQQKNAVIMGAGPTGIELACKLWTKGVKVKIVEGANTILPGFSKKMQERVAQYLQDIDVEIVKGSSIREVTDRNIILKDSIIPYSSNEGLIWTCGVRPEPFVRSLTGGGGMAVDEFLHYRNNIYALGDAIKGRGPPTAQNAVQQGKWLGNEFNQGHSKTYGYSFYEKGRVLDLEHCMFVEVLGTVWYVPYILTDIIRLAMK
jgi:NADH dehydrogenase FAD-containing subunit